jgi:hypothetical protein
MAELAAPTRRRVLLGGSALALVGGGLLCSSFWLEEAGPGLLVLSADEAATIEALTALYFPHERFGPLAGDGATARELDRLLGEVIDPITILPFREVLAALDLACRLRWGASFRHLEPAVQAEVLAEWSAPEPAARRLASDGWRALIGMAFLRRPELLRRIGWTPGCRMPR